MVSGRRSNGREIRARGRHEVIAPLGFALKSRNSYLEEVISTVTRRVYLLNVISLGNINHLCATRRYRVTVLTSSKCVP